MLYSFPSSGLGMQTWKLQLPVSRSWSFGFAVPKLELGNQKSVNRFCFSSCSSWWMLFFANGVQSLSQVMHRLFVPDIFALKRTNAIEEISRYSDFDRWMLGNEKLLPNLHDYMSTRLTLQITMCSKGRNYLPLQPIVTLSEFTVIVHSQKCPALSWQPIFG